MGTGEIIAKFLVTIFVLGSGVYVTVYCAHKIFMSRENFEKFLMDQSKFVRRFASWHKPSIVLNRFVYVFGLILGIIVLLIFGFVIIVFWK